MSTIGVPPDGHGALYALSAATGKVRWRLSTIRGAVAGAERGRRRRRLVSAERRRGHGLLGHREPLPLRRHATAPERRGVRGAGPVHGLARRGGRLAGRSRGTTRSRRHDVRDYDFQLSPVLATVGGRSLVFGAGKAGVVVAWDRASHRRVWQAKVGVHLNDTGPLPRQRTTVCPGLLGGAETPMAYAEERCSSRSSTSACAAARSATRTSTGSTSPKRGRGELVALDARTGRRVWTRRLPHAVFGCATVTRGVVFTATLDGSVSAFDTRDGTPLWSARARAGINSCPAVAGNTLLVGAGVPLTGSTTELTAYRTR